MTPEFLLTAFIVCVTPGIGVACTWALTPGGRPEPAVRGIAVGRITKGHKA